MRTRIGVFVMLGLVVATAEVGCASSRPKVTSAVEGLPPYSPEESALFGDELTPQVFGVPADGRAVQDTGLARRAERADAVIPVKVSTLSEESLAGATGYSISLVATEGPVLGHSPDGALELRVGPGNPSFGRVKNAGSALVGRRFLLFVKRYAQGGDATLHWHGDLDSPEVRRAVTSAKALDEGGGRVQTAN